MTLTSLLAGLTTGPALADGQPRGDVHGTPDDGSDVTSALAPDTTADDSPRALSFSDLLQSLLLVQTAPTAIPAPQNPVIPDGASSPRVASSQGESNSGSVEAGWRTRRPSEGRVAATVALAGSAPGVSPAVAAPGASPNPLPGNPSLSPHLEIATPGRKDDLPRVDEARLPENATSKRQAGAGESEPAEVRAREANPADLAPAATTMRAEPVPAPAVTPTLQQPEPAPAPLRVAKRLTPREPGKVPASSSSPVEKPTQPVGGSTRKELRPAGETGGTKPLPYQSGSPPSGAVPAESPDVPPAPQKAPTVRLPSRAIVPGQVQPAEQPGPTRPAEKAVILSTTVATFRPSAELVRAAALPAEAGVEKKPLPADEAGPGGDRRPEADDPSVAPANLPSAPAHGVAVAPPAQPQPPAAPAARPSVVEQVAVETTRQARFVQHGQTSEFSLRLNPPELGTVHVHLRATESGLNARFVVADEGTRQILEGQMHTLRTRLGEAGIATGSFDVFQGHQGSQPGWQWPDDPPTRAGAAARKSRPDWLQNASAGADRVDVVA